MNPRRYEITDFEWSIIAPLLPNKPRGVPRADDRRVLNGIFWRLRTGSPWADIPERYGPATTCYNRFVRWRKIGVWDRLFTAVSRAYDGDLQMVDSSSIRVHQHASNVNVWPAPSASSVLIWSDQSASTYPVSSFCLAKMEIRASWASQKGRHRVPIDVLGCRDTGRLSGHLASTTRRPSTARHVGLSLRAGLLLSCHASTISAGDQLVPFRSNAQAIRISLAARATTAVLPCARASRPRSQAPSLVKDLERDGIAARAP